jgi:acyl-lipid Delta6-acetylenase / acyl-lipid (9-3)-desaturase
LSYTAYETLEKYYIGDVDEVVGKPSQFEEEVKQFYFEIKKRGLFRANKWYYLNKFLVTTAIGLSSWVWASWFPNTVVGAVGAALIMGVFWQQCGWLAHDFAHHQVFTTRKYNDYMTMVIGSYLGFSLGWWKNKHNTHHAIPNVHETATGTHDGDPDIDTLPFLAWSSKLASKIMKTGPEDSALARFFVRNQMFVYFPLLLFARLTWALQSFGYVFRVESLYWGASDSEKSIEKAKAEAGSAAGNVIDINKVKLKYEVGERVALIMHYLGYASLMYFYMTPSTALIFFAISQTWAGLLIAIAFGVGHNGMPVFDAVGRPGFAELSVRTTRNVVDTPFNAWFTGGLHYQIEHHIFSGVPRHNLRTVSELFKPICAKYNIPHRTRGLLEGTIEILDHLKEVSLSLQDGPM